VSQIDSVTKDKKLQKKDFSLIRKTISEVNTVLFAKTKERSPEKRARTKYSRGGKKGGITLGTKRVIVNRL